MELTDYDVLGISKDATFRIVKNAYHDLSRVYHPDTIHLSNNRIKLTKEEHLIAFQRIQKAYENIKKKLNVVEVDLPQTEIKYEDETTIVKNKELQETLENDNENDNDNEFNKKFNKLFDKIGSQENSDNPYSVFYKEPDKDKRNLCDSRLTLHSASINKASSVYEFGINYVEDHSSDDYMDIRKINNEKNSNNSEQSNSIESIKETVDEDLENKLKKLLNDREEKFEMSEKEFNFIQKQKQLRKDIEKSKRRVTEEREIKLLN